MLVTKTGTVVAVAWHEGKLHRVLDGLGSSWDVSWLPDSRLLLVATGAHTLLIFDTATATKKTLTLPPGYNLARDSIALSSDGKALYFGDQRTEADVWMGSGADGRYKQSTGGPMTGPPVHFCDRSLLPLLAPAAQHRAGEA